MGPLSFVHLHRGLVPLHGFSYLSFVSGPVYHCSYVIAARSHVSNFSFRARRDCVFGWGAFRRAGPPFRACLLFSWFTPFAQVMLFGGYGLPSVCISRGV